MPTTPPTQSVSSATSSVCPSRPREPARFIPRLGNSAGHIAPDQRHSYPVYGCWAPPSQMAIKPGHSFPHSLRAFKRSFDSLSNPTLPGEKCSMASLSQRYASRGFVISSPGFPVLLWRFWNRVSGYQAERSTAASGGYPKEGQTSELQRELLSRHSKEHGYTAFYIRYR